MAPNILLWVSPTSLARMKYDRNFEMSHRYLTDPSLSSTNHALHSSTTNPAMLLNEYGPRRPTDPVEMRRLVLDYLCHHCFVDTASAFARESASNCNESRSEIMSDGPAHTTSKSVSGGDQSHQSTLAVKDTVVERTVRFDTDDDGDAEMGDLADVSCSRALPHPDTTTSTGISANAEGVPLHPTNDTSLNHEMTEDPLFNRPAESYPDWTAQDIQTTRIRLGELIMIIEKCDKKSHDDDTDWRSLHHVIYFKLSRST
jgi:hypothetical protein